MQIEPQRLFGMGNGVLRAVLTTRLLCFSQVPAVATSQDGAFCVSKVTSSSIGRGMPRGYWGF